MYHFYVQGERDGKGGTSACHYESMTELTGVNLVFHQCCNKGQYPQG